MAVKKLLFVFGVLLAALVVLETTDAHCSESSTHGELPLSHGLGLPGLDSFHSADADLAGGMKIGVDDVVKAWYMDDIAEDEDQRLSHHRQPDEAVPRAKLIDLGIVALRLDAENHHEQDKNLTMMREARGYLHMDIIELTPEKMPNYEAMIKRFFEEHLHTDEEVRYCLEGGGYFDVRDEDDRWIRVSVSKGGLIVVPAGIYHRFTLDSNNYIKAMRLFSGGPDWTAYNRPHDHLPARKKYLAALHSGRRTQQDRDN
uniref:Uncharacterized protein n=1 Tax=Avena sativa TaxID=4498 RepID=A0ACD5Y8K7_AVESA